MAPTPRQPPSSDQQSLIDDGTSAEKGTTTPPEKDAAKSAPDATKTAKPPSKSSTPKSEKNAAKAPSKAAAAPAKATPPAPQRPPRRAPLAAAPEQPAPKDDVDDSDLEIDAPSRGERTYPVVVRDGQRSAVVGEGEGDDEDEVLALRAVDPDDVDDEEADSLFEAVYSALRRPFSINAMRWRPRGSDGTMLPYIESSSVLGRLNAVVPGNWHEKFVEAPGLAVTANVRSIICQLTVLGVTHEDIGAADVFYTRNGEWAASDTSIKRVVTDARKRVAVCFGIGEYLSTLPPFHVEPTSGLVGTGKGGVQLTESGYKDLRRQYVSWLRGGGMDEWGEPIEHGEPRFVPPPAPKGRGQDAADGDEQQQRQAPQRQSRPAPAPAPTPTTSPGPQLAPAPDLAPEVDPQQGLTPSVLQRIVAALDDRGFSDGNPDSEALFTGAGLEWRNGIVESLFDPDLKLGEAQRLYAAIAAHDQSTGYQAQPPAPSDPDDDDIKF